MMKAYRQKGHHRGWCEGFDMELPLAVDDIAASAATTATATTADAAAAAAAAAASTTTAATTTAAARVQVYGLCVLHLTTLLPG